jgi:hypothetical protein
MECSTYHFIASATASSTPKSQNYVKDHFTCTSSHLGYCISCTRCGIPYIGETRRTRFAEYRRAVRIIANDTSRPVARYFNSGNHSFSDMKIRDLCPITGSNDSRKRDEMRLIPKPGTVHPYDSSERFSCV